MSILEELVGAVDEELAAHAVKDPGPGRFERSVRDTRRRFVLEAVYEGHLLHHGEPRAFAGMDPDLRLLAGDALYALGLSRLADDGDLEAVAELADLISLSARATAAGRGPEAEELWRASAAFLAGSGGGARTAARARR